MTTSEGGAIQRRTSDEQADGGGVVALVNEMIKIRKELGISQRKLEARWRASNNLSLRVWKQAKHRRRSAQ